MPFIQPKANITEAELAEKIFTKAGLDELPGRLLHAAARYIAAFYREQDLPLNGMVMWGSSDLKRFYARLAAGRSLSHALSETRSLMLGQPDATDKTIEMYRSQVIEQRKADAEAKRQAYLASDEHKHMNDPGWRGPKGTWSND